MTRRISYSLKKMSVTSMQIRWTPEALEEALNKIKISDINSGKTSR
ncbi:13458_t:CDS:2 [Funneliformis mosseae]|uniref:13458_t:CDS:1 n=1 Tax=Funneliformis mosseae TaxID=27381 RepID=A0A9N8W8V3_FUNMO|nr:13458_t:CDS:2 [Funneliformis mosseae]